MTPDLARAGSDPMSGDDFAPRPERLVALERDPLTREAVAAILRRDPQAGPPVGDWAALPPLGRARGEIVAGTLWQPASEGARVLDVLPLFALDADRYALGCYELLAWEAARPQLVWSRRGAARVLGESFFHQARHGPAPLRLFRTPLRWWHGGGAGACLLDLLTPPPSNPRDDPHWPPWRELEGIPLVVCDDEAHALQIDALLRRPLPRRRLPRLAVAQ